MIFSKYSEMNSSNPFFFFLRFQTLTFSFNKIHILQCGTLRCTCHFTLCVALRDTSVLERWPLHNLKRWPPVQNLIKKKLHLLKSIFSFIENLMHLCAYANEIPHLHMHMYIITLNTSHKHMGRDI